ncbi:lymphocyte function-associated antigen 3 isoform X1 [Panthera uncia]|uniref:lymphocyte function-associated antigen 3 isoform X1 n=1 Tax=Panthera uncia TaxID=29064 RepID=UPI0020FFBFF4|nr:lymphocyte function-associated antigen 3 isoform X1 [Panthera uncia]
MHAGRDGLLAAGILGVACLVLHLDFISCEPQPIYGTVNMSVTLYTSGSIPIKEIMWKKKKDKVVEWDEELLKPRAYPPFVDRVHLDITSGNLTIFNLTSSDEEDYEVELSSVTDTKFTLYVIEPLPFPTLNCTFTAENITVRCRIPETYSSHVNLIKYSWNCFSEQCQNSTNSSEVSIKRESDLSQEIECIISNPLSKQASSLVLATCVPDNSRHSFVIIAAVLFVVILAMFVLLYGRDFLKRGGERDRTEKEAINDRNSDPSSRLHTTP